MRLVPFTRQSDQSTCRTEVAWRTALLLKRMKSLVSADMREIAISPGCTRVSTWDARSSK